MDFFFWLAVFMVVWGVLALLIGIFKPPKIWQLGKIQGFVQLLGETGTVIMLTVLGLAALVGGLLWL